MADLLNLFPGKLRSVLAGWTSYFDLGSLCAIFPCLTVSLTDTPCLTDFEPIFVAVLPVPAKLRPSFDHLARVLTLHCARLVTTQDGVRRSCCARAAGGGNSGEVWNEVRNVS